jgi:hypothetical protein
MIAEDFNKRDSAGVQAMHSFLDAALRIAVEKQE